MIYAFYSYKGGVGRTMALANVAEFFYRAGLKVLMVDWDLEAPGLERYFPDLDLQDVLDKPGLIDMLMDYQNAMAKELDRSQTLELPSPIQYMVDIYAADPGPGKLLLMTAGRRSEGYFAQYAQAVLNFSWKEFYETWGGALYFNWLRDQFKNVADVILIDSRTGVTEMGGVCTYQLADTVVMFCAPNQQNLDGLSKMASNLTAASVQELRKHAFNLLIVPARIERAESELLDAFQQDFIEAFTPFSPWMGGFTVQQFWDLNIPYIPKYAYKEIVAVRESQLASAEDMAKAFYKLGQVLADLAGLKLLSSPIPDRTHSFDYYFIVPFVRNLDFVGRERDLARLHSALMREGPVGILPAGIIGMGGIGKTQLAVEYVYRYRELYPGGVFWINATESLAQGFARLGRRLDPSVAVRPLEQQVNAVSQYLQNHSDALLVIDNLLDVTALNRPVSADLVPAALPCRVLFTTRRRDVGRFIPIEVTVLPEDAAMRLLLRHPERHDVLDIEHPEHETAKDICAILGYLPLALEIAGAHLGRWPGSPLGVYREELLERGALPVLDDPRVRVSAEDLPTRHEAAVAVAISSQWEVLASEDARLLLRIAGQLPDATQIPTARLGLLAGLEGEGKGFFGSPLEVALQELHDAALIEPLQQGQIRLHPLVREFAIQQTPASEVSDLCLQLAGSLLGAYEDIGVLEEHCACRGVDAVQEDLVTGLSLLPRDLPAIIQTTVSQPLTAQGTPEQVATVNVEIALRALLRVLQREAHVLRDWDRAKLPAFFAQQLYNRAVAMDLSRVISSVKQRLEKFSEPYLQLCWRAGRESLALERTMIGHEGWVRSVIVTPDGRQAISGAEDGTVKVWDLETGTEHLTLRGHTDAVNAVAVIAEKQIISGSADRTLKVWDLMSGAELMTLQGHKDRVNAILVMPDERRIVSASDDKTVKIWDLKSGELLHTLEGHTGGVRSIALLSNASCIATGAFDRTVRIWHLDDADFSSVLSQEFDGPESIVTAIAATPDGERLVVALGDRTVRLLDWATGKTLSTYPGAEGWVNAISITPDGQYVVMGRGDGTIGIWDIDSDSEPISLYGHEWWVNTVAVTADGCRVISGAFDGTVRVWNLQVRAKELVPRGHRKGVNAVAVSADGRYGVSGSEEGIIKVWDLHSGMEILTLTGHQGRVTDVAIVPGMKRLVSASEDRTLRIWDLDSGEELRKLCGHTGWVSAVVISPDGKRVVSVADDRTVRGWNLETGEEVLPLWGHRGVVRCVAMTSDGRYVASGASDGIIKVWDLNNGSEVFTLRAHEAGVSTIAITSDNTRLISGASDRVLKIWNLRTGELELSLHGHKEGTRSIVVMPDDCCVVSVSEDRTVKIWDLSTGVELVNMALEAGLRDVAISADGKTLLTGDRAGNLYCFECVNLL